MRKGGVMRRWFWATVFASVSGLVVGGAEVTFAQPTSEGHPHKWLAVEKSLADFVAEGFELKTVVYGVSETGSKSDPDVHYFLQKGTTLVRCDFLKRDQASIYWCYQLIAQKTP
jgi:hypothetical protein